MGETHACGRVPSTGSGSFDRLRMTKMERQSRKWSVESQNGASVTETGAVSTTVGASVQEVAVG